MVIAVSHSKAVLPGGRISNEALSDRMFRHFYLGMTRAKRNCWRCG